MRRSVYRALSLLLAASVIPSKDRIAAQPAPSGRVVSEVAALLDSVVAVGRRQDTAAFRRLAAPDFVFVHSTGRVNDLLAFLDFMRQGGPERIVDLSPPVYRDLGDVVVVTTHQATEVPGRGRNAFRAVDVVRRDGGAWRWVAHQSTRLPNAPAFVALPDSTLDAYAGRYGPLTVTRDGARLLVANAANASARPAAFRPLTASTFHAEVGQIYLVFGRDAAGRVAYVERLLLESAERFARDGAR